MGTIKPFVVFSMFQPKIPRGTSEAIRYIANEIMPKEELVPRLHVLCSLIVVE